MASSGVGGTAARAESYQRSTWIGLSMLSNVCTHMGLEIVDSSPEVAMYKQLGFQFVDEKMEPCTWSMEIERICRTHDLSAPADVKRGAGGHHYTFLISGRYLFKVYRTDVDTIWFKREIEILQALEQNGVKHATYHGHGATLSPVRLG